MSPTTRSFREAFGGPLAKRAIGLSWTERPMTLRSAAAAELQAQTQARRARAEEVRSRRRIGTEPAL
jgi:hypothetical protein